MSDELTDEKISELMERTLKAREAIVFKIGTYEKNSKVAIGKTECPICSCSDSLHYCRHSNGHIHAWCATAGCVRWIE